MKAIWDALIFFCTRSDVDIKIEAIKDLICDFVFTHMPVKEGNAFLDSLDMAHSIITHGSKHTAAETSTTTNNKNKRTHSDFVTAQITSLVSKLELKDAVTKKIKELDITGLAEHLPVMMQLIKSFRQIIFEPTRNPKDYPELIVLERMCQLIRFTLVNDRWYENNQATSESRGLYVSYLPIFFSLETAIRLFRRREQIFLNYDLASSDKPIPPIHCSYSDLYTLPKAAFPVKVPNEDVNLPIINWPPFDVATNIQILMYQRVESGSEMFTLESRTKLILFQKYITGLQDKIALTAHFKVPGNYYEIIIQRPTWFIAAVNTEESHLDTLKKQLSSTSAAGLNDELTANNIDMSNVQQEMEDLNANNDYDVLAVSKEVAKHIKTEKAIAAAQAEKESMFLTGGSKSRSGKRTIKRDNIYFSKEILNPHLERDETGKFISKQTEAEIEQEFHDKEIMANILRERTIPKLNDDKSLHFDMSNLKEIEEKYYKTKKEEELKEEVENEKASIHKTKKQKLFVILKTSNKNDEKRYLQEISRMESNRNNLLKDISDSKNDIEKLEVELKNLEQIKIGQGSRKAEIKEKLINLREALEFDSNAMMEMTTEINEMKDLVKHLQETKAQQEKETKESAANKFLKTINKPTESNKEEQQVFSLANDKWVKFNMNLFDFLTCMQFKPPFYNAKQLRTKNHIQDRLILRNSVLDAFLETGDEQIKEQAQTWIVSRSLNHAEREIYRVRDAVGKKFSPQLVISSIRSVEELELKSFTKTAILRLLDEEHHYYKRMIAFVCWWWLRQNLVGVEVDRTIFFWELEERYFTLDREPLITPVISRIGMEWIVLLPGPLGRWTRRKSGSLNAIWCGENILDALTIWIQELLKFDHDPEEYKIQQDDDKEEIELGRDRSNEFKEFENSMIKRNLKRGPWLVYDRFTKTMISLQTTALYSWYTSKYTQDE